MSKSSTSRWIRQIHRWLSIAFASGVIINLITMQSGQPAAWVGLLALSPLVLLLLSGLYLFVLPYTRASASQTE
jgi:hypothetical protein